MTADLRRNVRLMFKFGLLVSLPVAGYLWALNGVSPLAIGMTAVCAVMAIGAESLASGAEHRLEKMLSTADADESAFNIEVSTRDERLRQMDRIVESLSNQNHDLRGKLVSLHGETHRFDEEEALRQEAEAAAKSAAANPNEASADSEESGQTEGGEVTDITSLRNRR